MIFFCLAGSVMIALSAALLAILPLFKILNSVRRGKMEKKRVDKKKKKKTTTKTKNKQPKVSPPLPPPLLGRGCRIKKATKLYNL